MTTILVKTVYLTDAERRTIARWADKAWVDCDQLREQMPPGSDQEANALDYQRDIEAIQAKVR